MKEIKPQRINPRQKLRSTVIATIYGAFRNNFPQHPTNQPWSDVTFGGPFAGQTETYFPRVSYDINEYILCLVTDQA